MTTPTVRAFTGAIPDTALVLAKRKLRSGLKLAGTSRFGDDVWVLTPAIHQKHLCARILDFRRLPDRFRLVAKQLFYLLLVGDLPPDCASIKGVTTIHDYFGAVRYFLDWVDERQAAALSALTPADFDDFERRVASERIGEPRRRFRQRAARLFWLCHAKLTADRLVFDPAAILAEDGSADGAGSKHGLENATARIPEPVHAPLLVWALRWVDDFADDLLRACTEWSALHAYTQKQMRRQRGTRGAPERLSAVLAQYRTEGRPLPGHHGAVNLSHLAREVQCSDGQLRVPRRWQQIEDAALDLGVDDHTYLRTDVRGSLDGNPWLPGIPYEDVELLARLLQTACYIVVAYLSGMRDGEVKHLQRGCLSVWCDDASRVVRRKVTSQAFKGENDPTGVTATWIVTAPVERAIKVLEALQPASQPYLFALPPTSPAYSFSRTNEVTTTSTTNKDLGAFARWITGYCAANGRADGIPHVQGQEWRLSTRQFRRTLAWFIARQPGGVIAGAMQYRHLRVQMFEGYAGTSDSGFRDEVQAEEAIARGEKLGDLIVNHDHHRLSGPAAEEAEARLAEFERHVQFHGKVFNDAKRMKRHMDRHDPHVYPGAFVICIHNADRALCHRDDGEDGPSLPGCVPLRCRNVALTEENVGAFVDYLATMDRMLANGDALAPYVRHRLEQRRAETARFLAANGARVEKETP
jgi:integrase